MLIIVKVPELIKPHLYKELDEFLEKKSKELLCQVLLKTYKGLKIKIRFVDIYDYPHNWKEFLDGINSILELDKS